MELTKSQQEGLEKLLKWEVSLTNTFTLTGTAGTGKSTLINTYLKQSSFTLNVIAVSAPTHQAKNIIGEKTGFVSETIQAICGLRPNISLESFNINNPQFDTLSPPKIQRYRLLIIDEVSMLPKSITQLLIKMSNEHNVKLLLLGDALQLPPINEKEEISYAFSHAGITHVLTEVVRQQGDNKLLEIINVFRNLAITYSRHPFIKAFKLSGKAVNPSSYFTNNLKADLLPYIDENDEHNTKFIGYKLFTDKYEFSIAAKEVFLKAKNEGNLGNVKYLSFTNKTVEDFNRYIRKIIFPNAEEFIVPGDLITGYSTIMDDLLGYRLINSQQYTVRNVTKTTNRYGIKVFRISIFYIERRMTVASNIDVVNLKTEKTVFIEKMNHYLKEAKLKKGIYWQRFFMFSQNNLIAENVVNKTEETYFGKVSEFKKSLDYSYACTVHKSQGSTYDTVIINGRDINKIQDLALRSKLWYVALSRARYNALILID